MKKLLSTTILVCTMAFSGAAFAHSEWYGKEGQDQTPTYMNHALAKLPAQKAADFRETMKDACDTNKPLEEQVRALHGDLHAILIAPDFDQDAFIAKRAQIQQIVDKMEVNRTKAFASAVAELSQKERVTLTRALHNEKHHASQKHVDHITNSEQSVGEPNASIKH